MACFNWLIIFVNIAFQEYPFFHMTRLDIIPSISWHFMMTSSNGNIFHVTGLLRGEFIPRTKASDAELWYFSLICAWPTSWVKQWRSQWFEKSSRSVWRHCNAFVHQRELLSVWQHGSVSTLTKIMACYLMAPEFNYVPYLMLFYQSFTRRDYVDVLWWKVNGRPVFYFRPVIPTNILII